MSYTLIDHSALFWPAYFATKSPDKAYEYAIDNLLWHRDNSTGVVVCCDSPKTLRREWCDTYKANRDEKPPEALDALRAVEAQAKTWQTVPVVRCDGYEADDVIATLVKQAWDDVLIVGQDKDLYSLLGPTVRMLLPKRGTIGPEGCVEKFGVEPEQMRDWLAIVGDTADNIEGCPGWGPGRATDILKRFGTLEEAKRVAAEDPPAFLETRGVGKALMFNFQEWDPETALKLVTLLEDAPVKLDALWDTDLEPW